MSTQGWLVQLPVPRYSTPSLCASCCGPRETELQIQTSEKRGNIRTTLTMRFPYCTPCSQRAAKERARGAMIFLAAMGIGAAFALAFAFANVFVGLQIRIAIAAVFAIPCGIGLALVTRPPPPPAPATSRGDAIFLRGTDGLVLCTNQRFADLLAQANGSAARPGSKLMTTESWAPFAVILGGGLAVAAFAYWAPGSMFEPARDDYRAPAYATPPKPRPRR